tara:strand:+ start:755 stop:1213 length:459 start_codon:yes stop_codon:yes gene_type:complete
MATTTATISISSGDLIPGTNLSINGSSTLMKGGLTTGLTQLRTGYESIPTGTEFRISPNPDGSGSTKEVGGADATHDIASWLYICNKATDDTLYVDWGLTETMIGRLYAGDWMFIPWNCADNAAEVEIEAQGGAQTIEYAWFASDFQLPTAG